MKPAILALVLVALLLHGGGAARGQCRNGEAIEPLQKPTVTSLGGSALMVGFPEFGTPSRPPRFYRTKDRVGSLRQTTWVNAGGCAVQTGEWGTFDLTCAFDSGSDHFSAVGAMSVVPPQSPGGPSTVIISGLAAAVNGRPVAVWCVTGGAQRGNGTYADWWPSPPYPATYGLKFISNFAYAGLYHPLGTIAWGGSTPLHTLEDEWDFRQQYDPVTGDLQEPEDNSRRVLDGVPQAGGPSDADYAGLVTASLTATSRTVTGTGECVPIGANWCKLTGTLTELLSDEDTVPEVMDRARAAALPGTSPTAFHTGLGADRRVAFCDVHYRAEFELGCAGTYQVYLYYSRQRRDSADPAATCVRIEARTLEGGTQTIEGDLDHPDPDTNYTFLGLELRQPCPGIEPGTGDFQLGSLETHLSLGRRTGGLSAGELMLKADALAAAIYLPAALAAAVPSDGSVEVVRDSTGVVRQVKAPQTLADIVILDSASYEVRFYAPAQVGAMDSTTRVYAEGGTPYSVYRFENPDAASGAVSRLRITETHGASSHTTEYAFDAATNTWELSRAGGSRRESLATAAVGGETVRTTTVRDGADHVVSKVIRTYRAFPWREELVREVTDPEGAALTTKFEFYDDVPESDPNYGRLKQRTNPDGSWERLTYDAAKRTRKSIRPFLDTPADSTDEALGRVTEMVYDTIADGDGDGRPETCTTTIERLLGREVGRHCRIDWSNGVTLGGQAFRRKTEIVCTAAGEAWDAPGNLVTETLTYTTAPFAGRPRRVVNPDGTATVSVYTLEADGGTTATVKSGRPNAALDDVVQGTSTVTVSNASGQVAGETVTDIASGLTLSQRAATEFDALNRPTRIDYPDGTFEMRSYACCGLDALTDRQGITTTYAYDPLGRLELETRAGISTRFVYDPEGRMLSRTRIGSDSTAIVQETNGYDAAGRRLWTKDALNRPTGFSEVIDSSGHMVRTTTAPDGGTRIETRARDGSLLSVTGTAVPPLKYEYAVDGSGVFTKEIRVGDAGEETEWTKHYTDFAGRPCKTVYADNAAAQSFYDTMGRLVSEVDPDGITALFAYNSLGEQEYAALDLNRNGVIDYSGTDRITRTQREVASAHGTTVTRVTTTVWTTANAADTQTLAIAETSADGRQSWQTANGLTTHTRIGFAGGGARTETTTAPDGTETERTFVNDRLASATIRHSALGILNSTTYAYDAHGRVESATDARKGVTTYSYYADDQVHTVTTPDPDPGRSGDGYNPQTTAYEYDSAGRLWKTTMPDGGIVTNEYDPTGLPKKTVGARTYPQEYRYDSQGRLKTLKTWQDYAGNGGAAVTRWNYDSRRGWLSNKRYADDRGPTYSYTAAGRVATRTWARGVVATYGYDGAGGLASVTYGDSTPPVALTYDRLGRLKATADAAGLVTRTYHASGQIQDETYAPTDLFANLGLHRDFDSFDRLAALNLASGTSAYSVAYGYDAASRLQTVSSGAHAATFGYLADSPLVQTVAFADGSATRLTTTRMHDYLDRLAAVSHAPAAAPAHSVAYAYNSANQRTRAVREDGAYWAYDYDALGQVTSGVKRLATGQAVPGYEFGWSFDDIGNRKSAVANGQSSLYTPNSLNQYVQRTVPGTIEVVGTAHAEATVTVTCPPATANVLPTSRQGEAFHRQVAVDNITAPGWADLAITGVRNHAGPAGEDVMAEETRHAFVPQSPERFAHDADGNLIQDGRWNYAWDAENRLVAMETRLDVAAALPALPTSRLEFAYDAQGRRIQKRVSNRNPASGLWDLASDTRFLYDGWNLIAELDGLTGNASVRSYVWGLDLSGSPQGAGGVGGLLFANLGSSTHAAEFDGNGNVIGLIDMTTGARSAEYGYNAFGETVRLVGPVAAENPFRFSTKYADADAGLLQFGARWYKTGSGRWLTRDAYEEVSGANLYVYASNAPTGFVDIVGFWSTDVHEIMTTRWASDVGFSGTAASEIGASTEAVDHSVSTGWAPGWFGNQSYHFNRNAGGIDSRLTHHTNHVAAAIAACSEGRDDPKIAITELGLGLHPLQDWVAHGDHNSGSDDFWSVHNSKSPQEGDTSNFPDDPNLDAIGGPLGRPVGTAIHNVKTLSGTYDYALYRPGRMRIRVTEELTKVDLKAFIASIRKSGGCRCRLFFLGTEGK